MRGGGGNRLTPGLPSPTVPSSEWLTSDTHTALVQRKTPTDSLGSLGVLASWGTRTPGTLQMKVGPGTIVTMDFNHPLAGETLTFSVTVRNVQSTGNDR